MKNLKKLITETVNLSKMDWAIKEDMSDMYKHCLLYTSPSPRDVSRSRMPSSA